MSDLTIKPKEVIRAWLHDLVPELCQSKTLVTGPGGTLAGAKMTYIEPSPVMKIEMKTQIVYMPITNIKAMFMKPSV